MRKVDGNFSKDTHNNFIHLVFFAYCQAFKLDSKALFFWLGTENTN